MLESLRNPGGTRPGNEQDYDQGTSWLGRLAIHAKPITQPPRIDEALQPWPPADIHAVMTSPGHYETPIAGIWVAAHNARRRLHLRLPHLGWQILVSHIDHKPVAAVKQSSRQELRMKSHRNSLVWLALAYAIAQSSTALCSEKLSANAVTNTIGLQLLLIPAGDFQMGTLDFDSDRAAKPPELPRHPVRITKPFYLGKYEVTRGQFREFCRAASYKTDAERAGRNSFGYTGDVESPYSERPAFTWENPGFTQTDEHPAVNVSWNDAIKFCQWLSQKEGKKYRLPTEAEWEWACRANTLSRWSCGNDVTNLNGTENISDKSLIAKNKYFSNSVS